MLHRLPGWWAARRLRGGPPEGVAGVSACARETRGERQTERRGFILTVVCSTTISKMLLIVSGIPTPIPSPMPSVSLQSPSQIYVGPLNFLPATPLPE